MIFHCFQNWKMLPGYISDIYECLLWKPINYSTMKNMKTILCPFSRFDRQMQSNLNLFLILIVLFSEWVVAYAIHAKDIASNWGFLLSVCSNLTQLLVHSDPSHGKKSIFDCHGTFLTVILLKIHRFSESMQKELRVYNFSFVFSAIMKLNVLFSLLN